MILINEQQQEPRPMRDPLAATALAHAAACGFSNPEVLGVCRDLAAPGTAAFWVGDRDNQDARLGVLINVEIGVIEEFNAREYKIGELPQGGLLAFFTTEAHHG